MDWTVINKVIRNITAFAAGIFVTKGIFTAEQASAWNAGIGTLLTDGSVLFAAAIQLTSLGGVIYHHYFPSAVAVQTAVKNAPEGTFLGRAGG